MSSAKVLRKGKWRGEKKEDGKECRRSQWMGQEGEERRN